MITSKLVEGKKLIKHDESHRSREGKEKRELFKRKDKKHKTSHILQLKMLEKIIQEGDQVV